MESMVRDLLRGERRRVGLHRTDGGPVHLSSREPLDGARRRRYISL